MLAKTNGAMLEEIFGQALTREQAHIDDGGADLPPLPPIPVFEERPHRPDRSLVSKRIINPVTGKETMVELSAASGYAIKRIVVHDFNHKTRRYKIAVEVRKSRGYPAGRPRKAADEQGEAS